MDLLLKQSWLKLYLDLLRICSFPNKSKKIRFSEQEPKRDRFLSEDNPFHTPKQSENSLAILKDKDRNKKKQVKAWDDQSFSIRIDFESLAW